VICTQVDGIVCIKISPLPKKIKIGGIFIRIPPLIIVIAVKIGIPIWKIARVSWKAVHYPFIPPSILELKTKSNLTNTNDYGK
jgi:hypothetical protein